MEGMGNLPNKPERPLDSDCCGQGCDPCILDIYAQELKIWEEECEQITSGKNSGNKSSLSQEILHACECESPLRSAEYNNFLIEAVSRETQDSYRFKFSIPGGTTLGLKTGQHIIVRGEVKGEIISRQYTPVSDVGAKGFFELVIKIYDNGRMSEYVRTWTAGTLVQIRGPCGGFRYCPNKFRKVYMLCVGTGIAPMAQVIQSVLNNDDDETVIKLFYGCKTYPDILLKSELDDWSRYWNFSCTFYLSQEHYSKEKGRYRYGDSICTAKITSDLVQSVITNPHDDFLVLICGTRSFEHDMIQCMRNIAVTEEKYHKF